MFTDNGMVFDSVDLNDELIKSEINKNAVLNRLFDTEKHKESGISIEFIKSYSQGTFDFIEAEVDIDFFEDNAPIIRTGSKSRYFNILSDVINNKEFNIRRAKLLITDTKNYLHLVNNYRGKDLNVIVMIDDDDMSIHNGRNPNKLTNTAVQLVNDSIARWKSNQRPSGLGALSSIGDDNTVKVRVVTYDNILISDMMNQENRYVEDKFYLDQDHNENVFINVFKNLEKYEVTNLTEDYIADVLDSRYFSVSNVVKSNLISEKDNKYLSDNFGVLKIKNTQKAFDLNDRVSDYIKTFLKGRELDRFYTKENIYIVVSKGK